MDDGGRLRQRWQKTGCGDVPAERGSVGHFAVPGARLYTPVRSLPREEQT